MLLSNYRENLFKHHSENLNISSLIVGCISCETYEETFHFLFVIPIDTHVIFIIIFNNAHVGNLKLDTQYYCCVFEVKLL